MNNFLEELKQYFEETPRSKVLEDWAKSAEFDNIGPTVAEFLSSSQQYCVFSSDPNEETQQNTINNFSPKFTSGFFLINKIYPHANSSLFNR